MLSTLDSRIKIIDFYSDYERYSRLKGIESIPCYLETLEYEEEKEEREIKLTSCGPTPEEQYQAAALLNQAEILANQRQQDKVMAAILLEQVGGEANV